jgi:4-hydroxythreonine-4-phosphate dehydrogenase
MHTPLAITAGDPAGIGPELIARLPYRDLERPVVVLGDLPTLRARAPSGVRFCAWQPGEAPPAQAIPVRHFPLAVEATAGRPDARNAPQVLALLDEALRGIRAGDYAGVVTAPLAKSVIIEGGTPGFRGHTEYLAERTGAGQVVMMLVGGGLRVALATTHLPLADVPGAITVGGIAATLAVLHHALADRFGIPAPRIKVCGLNPHAGESGHLGCEDHTVIAPAIARARADGIDAAGPYPADTVFTPQQLQSADAVLAMYHDQGLPVLKFASFGQGVNVTLGLPFVRTSVDHGTAFDIAGKGLADPGSLLAAVRLAARLVR